NAALDHLEPALARERDYRLPRDAVEEAVGERRVDLAVLDEEDVGAGAFSDATLPVEHHRVGIAAAFGAVLGDGADHVETGGFGAAGCGLRIGPAIFGVVEADALEALLRVEIARPFPARDGEVDGVALRRDAHHLRAAPGDRADIGFLAAVLLDHLLLGGDDLGNRIGDFEVEHLGRLLETFGMFDGLEDFAAVGALALEHAACVVQAMAKHMQVGFAPRHQLAVVPDDPFETVVGLRSHRDLLCPPMTQAVLNSRRCFRRLSWRIFRAHSNTLRRPATPGMKGSGPDLLARAGLKGPFWYDPFVFEAPFVT